MKKSFLFTVLIFLVSRVFSQVPEKINFQAVVRDANNNLVINRQIGVLINVSEQAFFPKIVYQERHTKTTDNNGLLTLEIGTGDVDENSLAPFPFSSIKWNEGPYDITAMFDLSGGVEYSITTKSQLLSVPYALHSKTAENILGGVIESDPIFLAWDKSFNDITNKPNTLQEYGIQDAVSISSNQTISGNKTFSGTITVPTPVNANDAVTKAYVDILLAKINALELSLLLTNGIVDERDGNKYKVVKLGQQIWLAENLRYLPTVIDYNSISGTTPYYYVYDNNSTIVSEAKSKANYTTYGVLYNWPAALNACPSGWHLPLDEEWTEMIDYLGGADIAGGKLKELGISHWETPNAGATNENGFNALPAGSLVYDFEIFFKFDNIKKNCYWWSSTAEGSNYAWFRSLDYSNTIVTRNKDIKGYAFSVRCIKD